MSYGLVALTSLLSWTTAFPDDGTREKLPTIQAALKKFIDSCAYSDPTSLSKFSDNSAGSCPISTSETCATGAYTAWWGRWDGACVLAPAMRTGGVRTARSTPPSTRRPLFQARTR